MTEPAGEQTPEPRSEAWAATAPEPEPEDDSVVADDAPADMRTLRKVRHEAAGLRVQLKEAEAAQAQLEGAAARLAALEHAEVERIASEQLHDGSDVWRVDPDVQQGWYDEEFQQLQPDKVREAIQALIEQKPHLARPQKPPTNQPIEGLKSGASPEVKRPEVTWSSVLRRG